MLVTSRLAGYFACSLPLFSPSYRLGAPPNQGIHPFIAANGRGRSWHRTVNSRLSQTAVGRSGAKQERACERAPGQHCQEQAGNGSDAPPIVKLLLYRRPLFNIFNSNALSLYSIAVLLLIKCGYRSFSLLESSRRDCV